MDYIENPYERTMMDALETIQNLLEKASTLPEGEARQKLLDEVQALIPRAKEEVEISERLKRIEAEHSFNITSED